MKKGISLPIQFIIIVILSVVVLVVILMFFFSAKTGAGSGITVSQAIAQCQNACLQDQAKLTTNPGSGTCTAGKAPSFCALSPIVEATTRACTSLTSCTLQFGTASCIVVDDTTCP